MKRSPYRIIWRPGPEENKNRLMRSVPVITGLQENLNKLLHELEYRPKRYLKDLSKEHIAMLKTAQILTQADLMQIEFIYFYSVKADWNKNTPSMDFICILKEHNIEIIYFNAQNPN